MAHEGKILHRYAKAHDDGVNGLLERYGGSRAGLYYLFGKEKLDANLKENIAKLYNTNVQSIWSTGGFSKRPLITASTPSIDFEFEGDIPTADELKEFMSLALAKMEQELKEKITAEVKKDIIDGLTKK